MKIRRGRATVTGDNRPRMPLSAQIAFGDDAQIAFGDDAQIAFGDDAQIAFGDCA